MFINFKKSLYKKNLMDFGFNSSKGTKMFINVEKYEFSKFLKNTKDENVKNHFVSLIFDKSIGELEKEKTTTNVSALKTTEPKKGFLSKTIKKISTAFSNVKKTVKNITKKNKK